MSEISQTATRITNGGRVVIPAEYRRALGVKEGDEVIIKLIDGEVRITTRLQELRRAQAIVAQYAGDDNKSWSDELITERRVEAENE
jgi:AbrB family looped-hinge helix DNA binding protein